VFFGILGFGIPYVAKSIGFAINALPQAPCSVETAEGSSR
jgi:hypothetical protein